MNKKITQIIPSVVLYLAAVVVAIYAVWAYSHCADIISQARAAGQLAESGIEYDVASFIMNNSGQYFIYAVLLSAVGIILQRARSIPDGRGANAVNDKCNTNDDDLDDWFNEVEAAGCTDLKDE
jgi:hypothetical protein